MNDKILNSGFTLVEVMVSMALLTTIFLLSTITLSNIIPTASICATFEVLVSDMRLQQLKAMSGNTEGNDSVESYGVYFEQDKYTLFRGFSYIASSSANFIVHLPKGVIFEDINLPASAIVFNQASGEVNAYDGNLDKVTVKSTVNNDEMTLELNKLGTITTTE